MIVDMIRKVCIELRAKQMPICDKNSIPRIFLEPKTSAVFEIYWNESLRLPSILEILLFQMILRILNKGLKEYDGGRIGSRKYFFFEGVHCKDKTPIMLQTSCCYVSKLDGAQ